MFLKPRFHFDYHGMYMKEVGTWKTFICFEWIGLLPFVVEHDKFIWSSETMISINEMQKNVTARDYLLLCNLFSAAL